MEKPENFNIEKIIEYLLAHPQTTIECAIIELYGDDYDEQCLTREDKDAIAAKIFECDECARWKDISEKYHLDRMIPNHTRQFVDRCKGCNPESD